MLGINFADLFPLLVIFVVGSLFGFIFGLFTRPYADKNRKYCHDFYYRKICVWNPDAECGFKPCKFRAYLRKDFDV